jgi:hypothetical protein
MSGSGFKTFNSGDVLTASDVQNYLMDQAVTQFADATARGAAITAPFEGQFAYLRDTNEFTVYDGTAWRPYNTSFTAYTPSYSNVTLGSGGTIVGFYSSFGRLTIAHVLITLGTTGSVGGVITVGLPSDHAYASTARFTGTARMAVAGTTFPGSVIGSAGNMLVYAHNASGTYLSVTATASNIPALWASGHTCLIQAIYEG